MTTDGTGLSRFGWGDRTVDEMAHKRVDVTYLNEETYERIKSERCEDTVLSASGQ